MSHDFLDSNEDVLKETKLYHLNNLKSLLKQYEDHHIKKYPIGSKSHKNCLKDMKGLNDEIKSLEEELENLKDN